MTITLHHRSSGMALIIVLLVMIVLGVLAGRFAYSMKVETALARKAVFHPDLEWMGRNGVQLACYILGQGSVGIEASYDALNQKWAGGTGTNTILADIPMDNFQMGNGSFSLKIIDLDRKFNINVADPIILQGALELVGIDPEFIPTISDSIQDWRDTDDHNRLSGAETSDYMSNPNIGFSSYGAKNGPIDDITELLLIRGVTSAMFWGSSGGGSDSPLPRPRQLSQSRFEEPVYYTGLVSLFTPLSSRLVNINTASATALQVIPQIDENIAAAIITARAGPDGSEGNEDDTPFRSPQEIAYRVPGFNPQIAAQISQYFTVRSLIFEVHVTAEAGGNTREFIAIVRRNDPRNVQILSFYWR